jgi:hypothetical protein
MSLSFWTLWQSLQKRLLASSCLFELPLLLYALNISIPVGKILVKFCIGEGIISVKITQKQQVTLPEDLRTFMTTLVSIVTWSPSFVMDNDSNR